MEFLGELPNMIQLSGVVFAVAFLIQAYYYLYYYAGLIFYNQKTKKGKVVYANDRPPVSVIICAKNEADNLEKFLPSVLEQDYPKYEVIVVNDGSTDESNAVLDRFEGQYAHLYYTFLPMEAKYMSHKKICLTVGIKAAKYDHLLLIDADCEPTGKDWITAMMRNYVGKTEIVLGYGGHKHKKGFLNSMICFDILFIAMQYMGFALKKKPYMGVGRNLSYKKELFFKNKGFASHLDLASGDDDLFVKEVADKENTRIEISPESTTWSAREMTFESFLFQKERHLSSSSRYSFITKMRIGLEVFSRGLFYPAFILLLIYSIRSFFLIGVCIAGALFLLRYVMQLCVINLIAGILKEKKFIFSLPVFDILLPLISLYLFTFGGRKKSNKYGTWR